MNLEVIIVLGYRGSHFGCRVYVFFCGVILIGKWSFEIKPTMRHHHPQATCNDDDELPVSLGRLSCFATA